MSIFNGYRLNFAGGFYTNVDTANNDDVIAEGTDPLNGMLLPPFDTMSDDDVRATFMKPSSDPEAGGALNSGWNYMGDYETRFMSATVTSCGRPGAVAAESPTIGKGVYMLGAKGQGAPVMVDVDPTGGGVGTQIFVGGLQLGEGADAVRILHDTVCYTYFMGPRFAGAPPLRSGFPSFGVWFHFSIPKSALPATATDPGIKQLLDAAHAAQGLVVRFAPFEVTPSLTNDVLAALFAQGQPEKNPAIGYLIGTIGIWGAGELASSPAGRVLTNPAARPGYSVALASVDPTAGLLSLDLVQAIPKAAFRPTVTDVSAIGPNRDVGPLQVKVAGTAAPVATFRPDPVNYWKFGGLVDLPVGAAVAKTLVGQALSLRDATGGLNWQEEPYRVESDQRGVYFGNPGQTQLVTLKVTEYGRAPTGPVTLAFGTESSGSGPDPQNLRYRVAGHSATSLTVPAGATQAQFTVLTNGQPGLVQLDVSASGPLGRSGKGTFNALYRVYPLDDYSAVIAAGKIPWALVYEQVLRYYYIIFPAMSQRIPLNRPDILTLPALAQQIKARMDDALFGSTHYMPITRSMSPGKKKLLFAYLDQGPQPAPPPPAPTPANIA
jgi:hypothetical protein